MHPVILCVDDQREVLSALLRDLEPFTSSCELIDCESAEEAWGQLDECANGDRAIPLVISDHVMPGTTGVDLLRRVCEDGRFVSTRKLLLTGLATHEDTIRAINQAKLDRYLSKPWQVDELRATVAALLTEWVVASGADHRAFPPGLLDAAILLEGQRHAGDS